MRPRLHFVAKARLRPDSGHQNAGGAEGNARSACPNVGLWISVAERAILAVDAACAEAGALVLIQPSAQRLDVGPAHPLPCEGQCGAEREPDQDPLPADEEDVKNIERRCQGT
jgi:hypothetical protein